VPEAQPFRDCQRIVFIVFDLAERHAFLELGDQFSG